MSDIKKPHVGKRISLPLEIHDKRLRAGRLYVARIDTEWAIGSFYRTIHGWIFKGFVAPVLYHQIEQLYQFERQSRGEGCVLRSQKYDWENIDWKNLSNQEIVEQMGANYNMVSEMRAKYAHDTCRPVQYDWKGSLLSLGPGEQLIVDNITHMRNLRNAGYAMGWKLKQKQTDKGIVVEVISRG